MRTITLSFKVETTLERKIQISEERYQALINYEDGLEDIEAEYCEVYPNYVKESIYANDIGY